MALDACPCSLELLADDQNSGSSVVLTLLACNDIGSARIMRQEVSIPNLTPSDAATNGVAPSAVATLRVVTGRGSSSNDAISALAGRLFPTGAKNRGLGWRCALAYGGESAPLFEQLTYASGPGVSQLFPQVAVTGEHCPIPT